MNELKPEDMLQRLERLVFDLGATKASEALTLTVKISNLLRQQNSEIELFQRDWNSACDLVDWLNEVIDEKLAEIEKLRSNISNIFEDLAKATGEWSYYYISVGKGGYLVSDVHKTLAELRKKYKEENNEI